MSKHDMYDVAIIGGGINGAAIARDAAKRGLSVILFESGDFGGQTSSASTKLIHGGLRYLEQYDFSLVRHSLQEQTILRETAPHLVWPQPFILPVTEAGRPAWLLRLGLWIYDLFRNHDLPKSQAIDLTASPFAGVLKPSIRKAFSFYDCWGQDHRLVIANLQDAAADGAKLLPHTPVRKVTTNENDAWSISFQARNDRVGSVQSRAVINAAGPWVSHVASEVISEGPGIPVRLVKGSHIITKRMFDYDYGYLFQARDGRVIFALPFENEYCLIGTTEIELTKPTKNVKASKEEKIYLINEINRYFNVKLHEEDILYSFAGIRPLIGEGGVGASAASREHDLVSFEAFGGQKLFTIVGGKLTGHRHLAEQVVDQIISCLAISTQKSSQCRTQSATLPGGANPLVSNSAGSDYFDKWKLQLLGQYDWVPPELIDRWLRHYGSNVKLMLDRRDSLEDLGQEFAYGLFAAELEYTVQHEWVTCAEDFLWRRTKWGLRVTADQQAAIENYIKRYSAEASLKEG